MVERVKVSKMVGLARSILIDPLSFDSERELAVRLMDASQEIAELRARLAEMTIKLMHVDINASVR
jgi:hypothetical protein